VSIPETGSLARKGISGGVAAAQRIEAGSQAARRSDHRAPHRFLIDQLKRSSARIVAIENRMQRRPAGGRQRLQAGRHQPPGTQGRESCQSVVSERTDEWRGAGHGGSVLRPGSRLAPSAALIPRGVVGTHPAQSPALAQGSRPLRLRHRAVPSHPSRRPEKRCILERTKGVLDP